MRSRKPHNNKYDFDPGRLRHKIEFYRYVTNPDGYGGVNVTEVLALTVHGAKDVVSLNQLSQLGITATETLLGQGFYVTIRKRKDFEPSKDMRVDIDGERFVFQGVVPCDDPTTYQRMLCLRSI